MIRAFGTRPHWAHILIFGAAYVLAGGLGHGLALVPGVDVTFWPPAGIFVAVLLLNPYRNWPWYITAGCLAELICNAVWFDNAIGFALIYFAANALEAITAALLIGRFTRPAFHLESLRDVAVLVACGAMVAPIVGATIIATTDHLLGKHPFTVAWPLVWLGDGSGLLVTTPLTIAIVQTWQLRERMAWPRVGEALLLLSLLVIISVLALRGDLPTAYLTMPPLLWAAARFQLPGAAVALAIITLLTAKFTVSGKSEFAGDPHARHLDAVMLQGFLGVSAVSALIVAALSRQHQLALRAVEGANAELEKRVVERTASLRASEERLRDADRRKDEFLATLAHELRNPLAALSMSTQVLDRVGIADTLAVSARGIMRRQIGQLTHLVDDLLDVSRISRDKLELKIEWIDLIALLTRTLEDCRSHWESRRHRLVLELPPPPLHIHADPTRLAQIVGNLLNNACKYTPEGGEIALSVRSDADHVAIEVRDTGIGIEPHDLTRVFGLFEQVTQAGHLACGGLGIGLSLVQRLAQMHGWSVHAHSDGRGKGSTFRVEMPIDVRDAEAAPANLSSPDEASPSRLDVTPRRILIVDDNADAAMTLAQMLGLSGHATEIAHDGPTALEVAQRFEPEVVLLDIGLPTMSGYDVCRRLRSAQSPCPPLVVAITGWGQDQDRQRSQAAGFDHHLTKPVDFHLVLRLIDENTAPRRQSPAGKRKMTPTAGG